MLRGIHDTVLFTASFSLFILHVISTFFWLYPRAGIGGKTIHACSRVTFASSFALPIDAHSALPLSSRRCSQHDCVDAPPWSPPTRSRSRPRMELTDEISCPGFRAFARRHGERIRPRLQ